MDNCFVKDTCGIYDKENKTCKYMSTNECYKCNRMFRLNKLFDGALLSNSQREYVPLFCDGDGSDRKEFAELGTILNNIDYFVKNGYNLYIHSCVCGNGKTSWALRFIQRYFSSIWKYADINKCHALFINVPRFLLALKDNISEKSDYVSYIKANILNADIVVWDDIGTKTITQFEAENLLSMIDVRMNDNKSNIFTSNMSNEELYEVLGQRLASRVINFSEVKEFKGMDKRKYKFGRE